MHRNVRYFPIKQNYKNKVKLKNKKNTHEPEKKRFEVNESHWGGKVWDNEGDLGLLQSESPGSTANDQSTASHWKYKSGKHINTQPKNSQVSVGAFHQ